MVQRGLLAEAKQHFVEYADRMQKAGRVDEAFKALKELADLTPNNEALRLMLAEQLKAAARTDEAQEQLSKMYAESAGTPRARQTLSKIKAIDPNFDESKAPKEGEKKGKSSDLVFLDLDAPAAPPPPKVAPAAAKPAPAPPKVAPPPPAPPPPPPPEPEPVIQRAEVEFTPPAMDLEPTSLAEEPVAAAPEPEPMPEPAVEPLAIESTDLSLEPASLDLGEPASLELETSASLDLSLDMAPAAEPVVLGPPDVPTLEKRIRRIPRTSRRIRPLAKHSSSRGSAIAAWKSSIWPCRRRRPRKSGRRPWT